MKDVKDAKIIATKNELIHQKALSMYTKNHPNKNLIPYVQEVLSNYLPGSG